MRTILFLLLISSVVAAQTPPSRPPATRSPANEPAGTPPPTVVPPKLDPPKSDAVPRTGYVLQPGSVDEAVANAMKQHPDVKLAEAKRLVAEAEWEQTRLLVTQRITNAFAKVEQAKARLKLAETQHSRLMELHKTGSLPQAELSKTESELLAAKSELAIAESDLLVAKGAPVKNPVASTLFGATTATEPRVTNTSGLPATVTVPGFQMANLSRFDKSGPALQEFIEKKVSLKLEKKGITVAEAFEILKVAAGRKDMILRLPPENKLPKLDNLVGEQTVLGWIELIMDEIARPVDADEPTPGPAGALTRTTRRRDVYQIYVRDYGLLMTLTSSAPQDAVTLAEFARMIKTPLTTPKP
jgi:hypothetical protein